jgi:hypothetical protein
MYLFTYPFGLERKTKNLEKYKLTANRIYIQFTTRLLLPDYAQNPSECPDPDYFMIDTIDPRKSKPVG